MRCTGKILSHMRDLIRHKTILQLELESQDEVLTPLEGLLLSIEMYKHNEKRSLKANAYYWKLVGQMAMYNHISNARQHNLLLRRYGTLEDYDGSLVEILLPDSETVTERLLEDPERHWMPGDGLPVWKDGKWMFPYYLIKGSRDYNTQEMSRLIDGTVDEAKEMGIETMTPDEIKRMMNLYEQEYQKKHSISA